MTGLELSDEILQLLEKAAARFLERGFQPPYIGLASRPINNLQTPSGLIEFRVDPDVDNMIYAIPKEFLYDLKEQKMNKLTITEVITGVPALVFDHANTITVYDPELLAMAIEELYAAATEGSEEESALRIAIHIFNYMGELLQNSEKAVLEIEGDNE